MEVCWGGVMGVSVEGYYTGLHWAWSRRDAAQLFMARPGPRVRVRVRVRVRFRPATTLQVPQAITLSSDRALSMPLPGLCGFLPLQGHCDVLPLKRCVGP